jgi:hypothetical protein
MVGVTMISQQFFCLGVICLKNSVKKISNAIGAETLQMTPIFNIWDL